LEHVDRFQADLADLTNGQAIAEILSGGED
jgi:hypothetical protein